jgi:acetate kinase
LDVDDDVRVLCFNAGSSSLKVALFEVGRGEPRRVVTGEASFGGESEAKVRLVDLATGERFEDGVRDSSDAEAGPVAAARAVVRMLDHHQIALPDAIGHRLVHGGPTQTAPLRLTGAARARLADAVPFAPLHLPIELAVVDAVARAYPRIPQVACFDTAFHDALPAVARTLPIARWARDSGVRRYGFHGLSYEYVCSRMGGEALDYAVIAHLGGGASMAAVHHGRSVDTTMGMSPTGGLMMGTRSGDLDPGALVYLMDKKKWGAREVEHFVNHESGLLGVSATTSDMQALLAARATDAHARLAVDLFVYTAAKWVGALAVALGGLRTLVFTGGIGAYCPLVRWEVAGRLAFLGVAVDPAKNLANAGVVSLPGASCAVHVTPTDEERVIAGHVSRCLA